MTISTFVTERRMHPRTQVRMPVQAIRLDPDGGDLVHRMEMIDISRGGMGLVSNRSYYPGQRLVLKLPAPGMGVRSICAVVRRCRPDGERYRLGIQFDRPIASLCAQPADQTPQAVAA